MRISDWSSDVCSSDLLDRLGIGRAVNNRAFLYLHLLDRACWPLSDMLDGKRLRVRRLGGEDQRRQDQAVGLVIGRQPHDVDPVSVVAVFNSAPGDAIVETADSIEAMFRCTSEEHHSELQSLMRTPYPLFRFDKTDAGQ